MAFKISPEMSAAFEVKRSRKEKRLAEVKAMDDKMFADFLEYCLINSHELLRKEHNDLLCYEDALVQVYIPEMLRRLRGKDSIERYDNYSNLVRKIEAYEK